MPILSLSRNLKTIVIHVAGWAAYLFTVILGAPDTDRNFWVYLFSVKIPVILLFYVCLYYIYPTYLFTKKYVKTGISLFSLIIFATLLRFFIAAVLTKFHFIDEISNAELRNQLWMQLRLNLAFIGISLALWYANRNIAIEKAKKEMENEILNAELKALKYQINPHFLYNTLSFMYAKALPVSDELSKAIAKLSEIMRYSLNGSSADGLVSIEKEVQHINNFIELQQLRFSNELFVEFDYRILSNERILPLILITFVENAFKHGVLNEKENPLRIHLTANTEEVNLKIINKTSYSVKETSSGIGLNNTIKRLQLAYPDKHTLLINEKNGFYTTELTLKNLAHD